MIYFFVDNHVADSEEIQLGIYKLHNIFLNYNLHIPTGKNKDMCFKHKRVLRSKMIFEKIVISSYKFLGCHFLFKINIDKNNCINGAYRWDFRWNKYQINTVMKFCRIRSLLLWLHRNESWTIKKIRNSSSKTFFKIYSRL